MTGKSKVAVLFTSPDTVLEDYERLFELAGGQNRPSAGRPHHPQRQHHLALPHAGRQHHPLAARRQLSAPCAQAGFDDLVCVQNQTVVTNAFKGEDLNGYLPIFRHYNIAGALQLPQGRHDLGALPPQGQDAGPRPHLPGRHPHPRLLHRQEHRPPAHGQDPHVHHHHRGDEERLRRPAEQVPPLHPHLDPRNPGRPAGHPEGNPPRHLRHHGRHHGRATAPGRA